MWKMSEKRTIMKWAIGIGLCGELNETAMSTEEVQNEVNEMK